MYATVKLGIDEINVENVFQRMNATTICHVCVRIHAVCRQENGNALTIAMQILVKTIMSFRQEDAKRNAFMCVRVVVLIIINYNLWFNGTACVPGDQCPPYEIAKNVPYVPLSAASQPIPLDSLVFPTEET